MLPASITELYHSPREELTAECFHGEAAATPSLILMPSCNHMMVHFVSETKKKIAKKSSQSPGYNTDDAHAAHVSNIR